MALKVHVSGGGTMDSADRAKKIILAALAKGMSVDMACKAAQRSHSSYDLYRKQDPNFRALADQARTGSMTAATKNRAEIPDFPEFSERYLDTRLFRHHLQWVDLLEGRPPRDLHPGQRYEQRDADQLVVNTPPDHGKSTTLTVNYVTWRICADPNIRVIIVSKTETMAKKFLLAIKDRLAESETYEELQRDFGPPGGFAEGSSQWSATRIYVGGRDSGEKDPTVEALGIGGHIYGARADLVILDDCVTGANAHEFEKQINWIQTEVGNRVASTGGRMLIIGTRLAPVDLYQEIFKPEYYADEESPWTYLTQPAVEEYAEDPTDWKTLWPRTNRPPVTIAARKLVEQDAAGLWPAKDGLALAKERRKTSARNWALVFQQEQVSEETVFNPRDVEGCTERRRYAGRMFAGQPGHRKHGMEGLYVVAGLDPAATNFTAAVVMGLDRTTGRRYILDVFNRPRVLPHELRRLLTEWTDRYGIQEWRVEKNAYQASIVQDIDIQRDLHSRGCLLSGHYTQGNKWDVDYGVAAMALLFQNWPDGRQLIEMPSRYNSEGVKALFEQLTTWFPQTKGRTDTVMAMWFAEIRCKELLSTEWSGYHLSSEYDTARDDQNRLVIDVDYALAQLGGGEWDGRMNW